jgi:hypothetical protein
MSKHEFQVNPPPDGLGHAPAGQWEHGPSCGCHRCRTGRGLDRFMKFCILLVAVVIALGVAWWLFDQWWIATHCTTVLGTRVCQS